MYQRPAKQFHFPADFVLDPYYRFGYEGASPKPFYNFMINGTSVADGLKDRLLSYMTSALPVGNHRSQLFLGQKFFEAWQQGLFKGPFFETIPPYDHSESLAERFAVPKSESETLFADNFKPRFSWADVDHKFPFVRHLRDRIWQPGTPEAVSEQETTNQEALWARKFFKHQWDSFDRVISKRQNLIVATGTGSGKTECFLVPILYQLLTEPAHVRAQRGIRALLVYPLNALVEDQSMRLRRLLFWLNLQYHEPNARLRKDHQITFGRYTGDTPLNATDHQRVEAVESLRGLGELVYREEMQSHPPDILITNFTMLEYMLLRQDDRQLFANPAVFSFIVLDEVHTYAGTQGMEVAMLLKRLRGFLESCAHGSLAIQCIGTSATIGGRAAKHQAAEFGTTLFGSKFSAENVVLGSHAVGAHPRNANAAWQASQWSRFLNLLGENSLDFGEESDAQACCKQLAHALGIEPLDVSQDWNLREALGYLFVRSGFADQVRAIIETQTDSCLELDTFADSISGQVREPRVMAGKILGLLATSTYKRQPVLSLRTHFFLNEAENGQVCLFPGCKPSLGGTDSWWRRLYIAHHTSCDSCKSRVYSLLLCRRCGFVYVEGWAYQSKLHSEKDNAERADKYERWLLRPIDSDLPEVVKETGKNYTLCLDCGRYFVPRDEDTFATTQEKHMCPAEKLLDIWAWRPSDLENGQLETCLLCEQHWISGEEVITKPAPSTYAVSTLLLEELKRQFDSSEAVSKIISFSDTRQQAAQLALRLQVTNREFAFRQMVFQAVDEGGASSEELLEELVARARQDLKLRLVLARDITRQFDNAALREQLATLLYREAVTAYLTLEAQGLIRIEYDHALLEHAQKVTGQSRILNRMSDEEKKAWLNFLMDWGLRFVRYALGIHAWGGPDINRESLKEWNIYPKNAALFRAQEQEIVGFMVRQRNSRNTIYNFASRFLRRIMNDSANLDIEEFQAAVKPFWDFLFASPQWWVKDASTTSRPLLNNGGPDAERCLIQLNFSSLIWRRARPDEPLFRCDHCGRLTFYSIKKICPIRGCRGTLNQVSQYDIDANIFSPVRHYRKLVRSTEITPLRVEEHTAQISAQKRNTI